MSWRLKLAVFLMLISVLGWLPAVAAPFLRLGAKLSTILITGGIIFGQISWNAGLIIGGAEAIANFQTIKKAIKTFLHL